MDYGRPCTSLLPKAILRLSRFVRTPATPWRGWVDCCGSPLKPEDAGDARAIHIYIDTVDKAALSALKTIAINICPVPAMVQICVCNTTASYKMIEAGASYVMDDASLVEIACRASSVHLVNCDAVTDEGIRGLRACRLLRTLDCNGFTSNSINELAYGKGGVLLNAYFARGHPSLGAWMHAQQSYMPADYRRLTDV
jgi:hypothetical protein